MLIANSTTQRCQKEIIKNFQIEDFFPFPNLELRISPRIFKTIRNGMIRGSGKLIHEKKPEAKNLVTLSL